MYHRTNRDLKKNASPIVPGVDCRDALDVTMGVDHQQAQLEIVLERAGVGIMHRDLQRRVLLVNQAYCSIVGRSPAELKSMHWAQLTHPDDVERSNAKYTAHLVSGEPFEIEKRYLRPDGTHVWCAVHVSFVLDGEGRPRSTITVACDITARRLVEQELRESEEHYRHTVELSPQIAWTAASTGAVLEVSSRWHEVTGVPQCGALGEQWAAALHPDDVAPTKQAWDRSLASGEPVDIQYRLRTKVGSYRWFRSRAAIRLDEAGAMVRWYGSLDDVHERRVAEAAMRDSEERFRLAAQAAGLGVWDYDAISDQREWSDEFKVMLGFDLSVQPSVTMALERVVSADRHLLQALVDAARAGDSSARFEVSLRIRRASDGAERWMKTAGWRMHASSGRLSRVLVTIRDVTDERTAEDRIRWTANHDAMTGVPNRAFFSEQLDSLIHATGTETKSALILFDVDRLKEVNDTFGHDAGDVLLRTFAARLRVAFGDDVVIGRLGGDEFAVFLAGIDVHDAQSRVEQALRIMCAPFDYEGHALDTQATAGVAFYPAHGSNTDDLLKAADIALYAGKSSQRGVLSIFESSMRSGLQRQASMLNVARMVVRDRLVVPYYQAKVDLSSGRTAGFEALLRWRHQSRGIQEPATISAAFDDTNLAIELGDQMRMAIAHDLRRWLDMGLKPGRIAINLSPAEFRHDDLASRVLDPFLRLDLPREALEVEITETVLLGRDADKILKTLAQFREEGARIALDDFGTGYASLTHLKSFPVDVIKIDRSFVTNLRSGSDDAAIVDAVVGLAQRLRIEVVAEGVENAEQLSYLKSQGCEFGQGFLFGRPMPAGQVESLLA